MFCERICLEAESRSLEHIRGRSSFSLFLNFIPVSVFISVHVFHYYRVRDLGCLQQKFNFYLVYQIQFYHNSGGELKS